MQFLLSAPFAPFTLALALAVILLLPDVVAAGLPGRKNQLDPYARFDFAADAPLDIAALLQASAALDAKPGNRLLSRIGLGHLALQVAAASLLFSFGIGGFFLQVMAMSFGPALSPWVALPIAGFGSVRFAPGFAATFATLIPRLNRTVPQAHSMAGLRGVVTQGTARRGHPAVVSLRDRQGIPHQLRCEPFRKGDVIVEGTAVFTLRQRRGADKWHLCIIPLT